VYLHWLRVRMAMTAWEQIEPAFQLPMIPSSTGRQLYLAYISSFLKPRSDNYRQRIIPRSGLLHASSKHARARQPISTNYFYRDSHPCPVSKPAISNRAWDQLPVSKSGCSARIASRLTTCKSGDFQSDYPGTGIPRYRRRMMPFFSVGKVHRTQIVIPFYYALFG
jgi:hypothetical protein